MKASILTTSGCFVALGLLALAGCGSSNSSAPTTANIPGAHEQTAAAPHVDETSTVAASAAKPARELHPLVVVETSLGPITVKLAPEKAPQTVENFLDHYVSNGSYDRTIVHYVQKGFIISAGGYTPAGEPIETRPEIRNEASNGLKNKRGTIAMARHPEYIHSATSQFFFNISDNPGLDHRGDDDEEYGYCVFGEVVKGLEVLDRMAEVTVQDDGDFVNRPIETVMIESIRRIR